MTKHLLSAGHLLSASAAVAALLLAASPAMARHVAWTGPHGGAWNRSVTHYNNGGGNVGRTVATTRPNGKTATGTVNRGVSNGTITDTRNYTGYNGRTASATMTRTPGEGGSKTVTGPDGGTYTRSWSPN